MEKALRNLKETGLLTSRYVSRNFSADGDIYALTAKGKATIQKEAPRN